MYQHTTQIRVRYGETDQMGYLYYGNYAQYYEIGRVEMIRSLGLTYKEMEEEHGVFMPVTDMQVKYLRPIYYDNLVTVRTTVHAMPDKFINFETELLNEAGKLCNTAHVRLCFFDGATKKLEAAPEFLLEKMRPFFGLKA
jgi:acyl-CoA thioester hydrolase